MRLAAVLLGLLLAAPAHAEIQGHVTIRYVVPALECGQAVPDAISAEGPRATTVVVELWSWRSFVFTFQDSTRGDTLTRVLTLPVGYYNQHMRCSDQGGTCDGWTPTHGMVSKQ